MNTTLNLVTTPEAPPVDTITMLPSAFDENEFNECLDLFKPSNLDAPFRRAYTKSGSRYIRVKNPTWRKNDLEEMWQIYAERNRAKWRSCVAVYLVAQYIYEHRVKVGRKGDQTDDYLKAEYLLGLVNYLNQKGRSVIQLRQDDEMEEIIDEVNNIFDSAYFRKLNHPDLTDMECFLEAEREFCEEKDIDFLLYQKGLGDYRAAEKLHQEQEIRSLAYRNFESRIAGSRQGDDLQDWIAAEKKYPEWRIKRRIATICWNLSADKRRPQDDYWLLACQVIDELERRRIPYATENPYTPAIYEIIVGVVGPQPEPVT